jgi:hypothetical protein
MNNETRVQNTITTIYDALGLLAIAVGASCGAFLLVGWASILVGGVIMLMGVRVMDWVAAPSFGVAASWCASSGYGPLRGGWTHVSLFSKRVSVVDGPVIPDRPRLTGAGSQVARVTEDTALRHSAVWAALRLRADLVSSMPVDVYRKVAGIQVEMQKPPVLITPGGSQVKIKEWMYSSQVDLDRAGNV